MSFIRKQLDRPPKDFFTILKEELVAITRKVLTAEKLPIRHDKRNNLQISRQPKLIKAFLIMYFGYLKETVLNRLLSILKEKSESLYLEDDDNIGYMIHVEKDFLDDIVGSKENMEELMITSGIWRCRRHSSPGRRDLIFSQGEGLLPILQKRFKLDLALNHITFKFSYKKIMCNLQYVKWW